MLLASCWFECLPDTGKGFDDSLRFLLEKLLISAKLDPFAGGDVLLDVDRSGEYRVLEFPNFLKQHPIHPTALDFLTQQREWPVSWNPLQLKTLGTIELGYVDDDETREFVAFWVTSTFEDVEKYLQKKLALLRKFLAHDGCVTFNSQHLIEDAIHSTIHNAAEVIALLSEHDYYGQGPPWLRHRFKKLVRIGAFILATLTLLLNFGRTHLADQPFLDRISRHAQSHNARIFCIWRKAFREVSRGLDSASFNQSSNDCYIDSQTATSIDEQNEAGAISEGEWETESSSESSSEWETEEEWEDGYMLDTAVDRSHPDDYNPQIQGARHTCSSKMHDYDEKYWSHLYPRIKKSNVDGTCSKPSEGKLKGVAHAALSLMSFIV